MYKSILLISALLLCLVAGCGRQDSPMGPGNSALVSEGVGDTQAQVTGAEILSAQLSLFVGFPNSQPVNVHRVIDDWDPSAVTWNSFAGGYSATIEDSYAAITNGRKSVDVTALVQSWANETQPNYGLLLDQATPGFSPQVISSIETGSLAPFLEICYNSEGVLVCDTIVAQADVYIDEAQPDNSREGASILLVGKMMAPGAQKRALIRFAMSDLEDDEPSPASISGVVWDDLNQDGVLDQNEPGLPNVVVNLYDCIDNFLFAGATDVDGGYLFADLQAGSYQVEFVAPDGYVFSPPGQADADSLDSDADPVTGRTICIAVLEGDDASFWSAGLYVPADPDDPDDPGCTKGKGYWKNHAGFGRQMDELSDLLPISLGDVGGGKSLLVDNARTAVDLLAMKTYGSPKNGITKLYAHLLAAKLNVAAGADAEKVAATIDEADAFLADRNWVDWKELDKDSRKQMCEWKDILESYNNGEIGPGACE